MNEVNDSEGLLDLEGIGFVDAVTTNNVGCFESEREG